MSRAEFAQRFPDEAACAWHLSERRWPNGFICPACDGGRLRRLDRRTTMMFPDAQQRESFASMARSLGITSTRVLEGRAKQSASTRWR